MIKLIVFDLDGVLVNARELHYEALNEALMSLGKKYVINREEHLSLYDGLSTKKKLKLLTEKKGMPTEHHDLIWRLKQEKTLSLINTYRTDKRMKRLLSTLKKRGYVIMCATNSIRDTAKLQLIRKGLMEHIDILYTNQDVNNPKPHPEIYLKCILKAGVSPRQTLVIEDSHHGRKAALESGSHLCPVVDTEDVTLEKIDSYLNSINDEEDSQPGWQGGKMNVLIPMAGAGTRFQKAGYTFPKPLIEIDGKPMIQIVKENLNIEARHIFIVQEEHYEKYNLNYLLKLISPGCVIIQADGLTEGAACTTLLASEFINNDEPLLISNSDQYVEWDSNQFMYSMMADQIDAGMATFSATHPKWSFAKLDSNGFVSEVAEKKPISNIATCGIYYWKKGADYIKYAEQMIEKNIRVNNEFYVCPVFNEAIKDGKKIKTFSIDRMWGLGTPEDLNNFLRNKQKTCF
jgi:HAD superfamily hydrolase (TIGR01509 family)